MQIDPRTPVIVGVSQLLAQDDEGSPIDLMVEAIGLAEADAGSAGLARSAQIIGVVPVVSWRYYDPSVLVAEAIGATPAERWYPPMGGNSPQTLANKAARAIAAGDADIAVLTGAESFRTRMRAKRAGESLPWDRQDDSLSPTWGGTAGLNMSHPAELAVGIPMPTQCYPLLENALRHQAGRTADEHTAFIAELWAGFSRVAATNPYAVDRMAHSAADIATVTADNRMIGFPYTKHMVSNPDLNASTALLMCSAEAAEAAGVSRDRWVFPWSGTDAVDPLLSNRPDFVSSAAIRIAGRAALDLAGVEIDDVAHLDVYSCFPSAVEIACAELGISTDRQLTTYGGLCFAGGPWNNPVGHAISATVGELRADEGSIGLVTANGGNLQKHAFGVYSTSPPPEGYRSASPQFAVDAETTIREVDEAPSGDAVIESWTVMHERDGSASRAHAAVTMPTGQRAWAQTSDEALMAAMEIDDMVGTEVTIGADAELTLR